MLVRVLTERSKRLIDFEAWGLVGGGKEVKGWRLRRDLEIMECFVRKEGL